MPHTRPRLQLPVTADKWYARDMADLAAAQAAHGKKFAGGFGGVAKVCAAACHCTSSPSLCHM